MSDVDDSNGGIGVVVVAEIAEIVVDVAADEIGALVEVEASLDVTGNVVVVVLVVS